ncbi:MAG: hypothetical protein KJ749_10495 [Planctomycetes bacterium]|nr:hypothetical protein [Planctomycetota bacterium]
MTRWGPGSGAWSHESYEDWNSINAVSYGGIAAWQSYVYVTDMETAADVEAGIVRFNTANGTAARYFDSVDFADLTIGFDGLLYALWPDAPVVYVIDPLTMAIQRSFWLSAACHGIAVDAHGHIFGASGDGNLYEFSGGGGLLGSIAAGVGSLSDVDVAADGSLVAGSLEGWVVLSDETLQSVTSFRATNYKPVFVGFTTPVPEPATIAAVLLLTALARWRSPPSATRTRPRPSATTRAAS